MSIRRLHIFIIRVAVVWRYFFRRAPYQEFVQGMTFREGIRWTNYRFYSSGIERFCSIPVAIIASEYQEHSASPVRGDSTALWVLIVVPKIAHILETGAYWKDIVRLTELLRQSNNIDTRIEDSINILQSMYSGESTMLFNWFEASRLRQRSWRSGIVKHCLCSVVFVLKVFDWSLERIAVITIVSTCLRLQNSLGPEKYRSEKDVDVQSVCLKGNAEYSAIQMSSQEYIWDARDMRGYVFVTEILVGCRGCMYGMGDLPVKWWTRNMNIRQLNDSYYCVIIHICHNNKIFLVC